MTFIGSRLTSFKSLEESLTYFFVKNSGEFKLVLLVFVFRNTSNVVLARFPVVVVPFRYNFR